MSLFVCWSSAGREDEGGSSVADQGLTSLAPAADPRFVGSGHDDMWKATPSIHPSLPPPRLPSHPSSDPPAPPPILPASLLLPDPAIATPNYL